MIVCKDMHYWTKLKRKASSHYSRFLISMLGPLTLENFQESQVESEIKWLLWDEAICYLVNNNKYSLKLGLITKQ